MPRNLFSRLVPSTGDDLPWYEQRSRDPGSEPDQDRLGLLDEENLTHQFQDDDLERAQGLNLEDSQTSTQIPDAPTKSTSRRTSKWLSPDDEADLDNDVPASLLVEGPGPGPGPGSTTTRSNRRRSGPQPSRHSSAPNRRIQAQWETAQAQQRLHPDDEEVGPSVAGHHAGGIPPRRHGLGGNPRDKAMFRWANVSNLDVFIRDVYDYYLGAGIWCILLERFLHLL